jgi:hypothetical protein
MRRASLLLADGLESRFVILTMHNEARLRMKKLGIPTWREKRVTDRGCADSTDRGTVGDPTAAGREGMATARRPQVETSRVEAMAGPRTGGRLSVARAPRSSRGQRRGG